MNVLFVCRHNRFRSKVGEALFKKYTSGHEVKSVGVKMDLPYVAPLVKKVLKEYGVGKVDNIPRMADKDTIEWADKIIVDADNVNPELFEGKDVEHWKIRDCDQDDEECILLRVEDIDKRVKDLIRRIKKHQ